MSAYVSGEADNSFPSSRKIDSDVKCLKMARGCRLGSVDTGTKQCDAIFREIYLLEPPNPPPTPPPMMWPPDMLLLLLLCWVVVVVSVTSMPPVIVSLRFILQVKFCESRCIEKLDRIISVLPPIVASNSRTLRCNSQYTEANFKAFLASARKMCTIGKEAKTLLFHKKSNYLAIMKSSDSDMVRTNPRLS